MTRYRWVLDRKAEGFPITMASKVAEVSRQAFNDWRARVAAGPTDAEVAEAALVAAMREIHTETDETYAEPRMTPELIERGFDVNHRRVERLQVSLMSRGLATSPTSQPGKAGSTSRACRISAAAGGLATRWLTTCAPNSSPTPSTWPWRHAAAWSRAPSSTATEPKPDG